MSKIWLNWNEHNYELATTEHYKDNVILRRPESDYNHDHIENHHFVMFNLKTSESKLLPCCCVLVLKPVIVNEFLYILGDAKSRPVYRIDLSKCVEWEELKGIEIKRCIFFSSRGNKLLMKFRNHLVFFNPDTQEKTVVNLGSSSVYGYHLEVRGKCYCLHFRAPHPRKWKSQVYNMESQLWEDLPRIPKDFQGYGTSKCSIRHTHVYNNRWILVYMEHDNSVTWNFWIFDTYTVQWVESKQFSIKFPNFVWIRDTLLRCECYNLDERSTWSIMNYGISHFVPNWYFIDHLVFLRQLVDTGRAYCTPDTKNEFALAAQKLMMDLNLDTFRTVLSYLHPRIENKIK